MTKIIGVGFLFLAVWALLGCAENHYPMDACHRRQEDIDKIYVHYNYKFKPGQHAIYCKGDVFYTEEPRHKELELSGTKKLKEAYTEE